MTRALLERISLVLHVDVRVLSDVMERLGWTLLHSLWQFAAVAVVLIVVRQLLARGLPSRHRAHVRYLACAAALAVMPGIACLTFALTTPSAGILVDERQLLVLPDRGRAILTDSDTSVAEPASSQHSLPFDPQESMGNPAINRPQRFENRDAAESMAQYISNRFAHTISDVRRAAAPWLGPIVACWLCGVVLTSLRPAIGMFAVRRLSRRGLSPAAPAVRDAVARLVLQLGVRRAVTVVQSALIEAPAIIGWLKPMVLLPASIVTALTPAELEAILAHELAHVRRHDYLVNLAQMFVETVFFYHPAVWWISHVMRAEREDCCDDLVVRVLGNRANYARALVTVDELRGSAADAASNANPLVPVLSARGGTLKNRVRRIMGLPLERQSGWVLTPLLLGLCAAAIIGLAVGNQGRAREPAVTASDNPADNPAAAAGPTLINLVNAKDEAIGGRVNLARIGYVPGIGLLPAWDGTRHGGVSLEGLGAGTHTLVVDSDVPNATVFTAKVPTANGQPLRQRVLPFPAWYIRRAYETPSAEVSVIEQGRHDVIEVLLTNSADETFTFSAADFRLSTDTLRVLLPDGMHQGGKTIKPHSTQKLRFDWAEIVRKGIWLSRHGEDTSGPAMPPDTDGKMNFWLTSGINRSLPITLTDPALVLADFARPQAPAANRATLSGRIVYDGPRPVLKRITFPAPDLEAWARDGKRGNSPHRPSWSQIFFHDNYRDAVIHDETIVAGPENGLANVLIWVRPIDPKGEALRADAPPVENAVSLDIKQGRFSPHVLALGSWQSLQIRNRDLAALDVVAAPNLNAGFNRLLQPDASLALTLRSERLPFKVQSNLGSWMMAYVLPLDHSCFAVTQDNGNFRIDNIPTGEWELVFWHELCGWLPLTEYPKGRVKLALDAGEKPLGDLHLKAETIALEKPGVAPAKPAPAQAKTAEPPPRELPLGNFGGIPQRDQWPLPAPSSGATEEDGAGWIDAEFGLQYRLRMPDAKIVGTVVGEGRLTVAPHELPLLYVDMRNVGDKAQNVQLDLGIESHQTRHAILVDGVEYTRQDQPWGGVDPVPSGGASLTLPFILSEDWKSSPAQAAPGNKDVELGTGLKLAEGAHRIAIRLHLHEFAYEPGDDPDGPPRKTLRSRGSRALVTQPFYLMVAQSREADPPSPAQIALENIRRELVAFPKIHVPRVSSNLRRLVVVNQPASGDRLIARLDDGNDMAPDPASFIVATLWKSFSRDQLERYLKAQMTHFIQQRAAYPAGVDAAIAVGPRFRSGYSGLPKDPPVKSETVTTHFLDGKPVGEPFRYPLHTSISHWIRTGDLAVGKHTIRLVTDYQFQAGESKFTGRIESPEYAFEIVPADSPDELAVAPTNALQRLLRESLEIREITDARPSPGKIPDVKAQQPGRKLYSTWGSEGWAPQIRTTGKDGKGGSLHTPAWQLFDPLPVDLCYRTEFRIEGTDVAIAGAELVVFAGETRAFYFMPQNMDMELFRKHVDKDGFIPVRIVLTPSRSIALSHPRVKQYYDDEFVSDVVRLRVDHDPKAAGNSGE